MTDERHPDVDALPERTPNTMLGILEVSAYVETFEEAEELGILDNYKKFLEKAGSSVAIRCWFLRASGLDVRRDDGQPFYQSDLLKLVDRRGRPLTQGMPPADLSAQFRTHQVSASPSKIGSDDSAVGRVFQFEEQTVSYGSTKKRFSLWPTELKPVGFEYDGEVTIVAVSSNDSGSEAPAEAPKLSEDVASKVLIKALTGKTPAQMLDAVLATESLKGVNTVFGVDLLEAATDESLATVLTTKGYMSLNGGGTLEPAVEATA